VLGSECSPPTERAGYNCRCKPPPTFPVAICETWNNVGQCSLRDDL
jgi:hypothetical protein